MIKVKILNPTKDRNEPTFRPFLFIKDMLRDYSIDLTESDDFDFMFIGMSDFWDMSMTLKDSTEWGLENINKVSEGGDYFLFDGFDSTSLKIKLISKFKLESQFRFLAPEDVIIREFFISFNNFCVKRGVSFIIFITYFSIL